VSIPIGTGYTYTKYNTLLHFLNVAEVRGDVGEM